MQSFFETAYPATGHRGAFSPAPADHVDARMLAADTAERHAIPEGASYVAFAATGSADFWVLFGGSSVTAAIPSGDITDGSAPELSPAVRRIPADATHISLIAAADTTVVLSFYGA